MRSMMGSSPLWSSTGFGAGSLLYIIEIGSLRVATSVFCQLYADGIQSYLLCLASSATAAVMAMSKALGVMGTWRSTNRLQLNPSKTKFIFLSSLALGSSSRCLDLVAIAADFLLNL